MRARDRQEDAWQRLVRLYHPLVRHWCRRGGVAPQDIDDVVQEVFAKAYAVLHTFRHEAPTDTFRGWLCGVTQYRVLEHFRRLRRQLAATGGSEAQAALVNLPDWKSEPDDEEQQLGGQQFRHALELIRTDFETRTWTAFWRSVVDGVATAAVAAELGITPAAVRQARSRVLRRMREETAGLNLVPARGRLITLG